MKKLENKDQVISTFQELLLLFKGVINLEAIFIEDLLKDSPVQNGSETLDLFIRNAIQQGWIQPIIGGYRLYKINPILPFIGKRKPNQLTHFSKTVYIEHQEKVANILVNWMYSKDIKERNFGLALAQYEIPNLLHALWLAFENQANYNIIILFSAIEKYWHFFDLHSKRLTLAESILQKINFSFQSPNNIDPKNLLAIISSIGEVYQSLNESQKAIEAFQESFHLLKANKTLCQTYPIAEGILLLNIANQYFEQNNFAQAQINYLKAQVIFEKLSNNSNLADIYNNLGLLADVENKRDLAIDYLQQAISIYESLERKEDIASCYQNMGVIEAKNGNSVQANHYWEEALILYEAFNNDRMKVKIYHNLANMAYEEGNLIEERKYLKNALTAYIQLADFQSQIDSFQNLGRSYYETAEFDIAINYFERALSLFKDNQLVEQQGLLFENIGICFLQKENARKAFDAFEKALLYFLKTEKETLVKSVFKKFLLVIREQEDYHKIYDLYQKIEHTFSLDFLESLISDD